jgi:hypothetical protein
MNQIKQRVLYNLLRMNWLNEPGLTIEPWQVENYRELSLEALFGRLKELSIQLDKLSFITYAQECDSPEDLTGYLIGDQEIKAKIEDQIYLLIFELWRRLMNEKPSISIFCDELDYQIYLYDQGELKDLIPLQQAMINLLSILEENVDEGISPKEAFSLISDYCANDLETFLYDFISDQIDEEHESYARELLDGFQPYLKDNKWFILLRARLLGNFNSKISNKMLSQILEDHLNDKDLEFNLEVLSFMTEIGNLLLFRHLVKETSALLIIEEDFQDLLSICADFYHRLDLDQIENAIQTILKKRSTYSLTDQLSLTDPDLNFFLSLIDSKKD